MVKKRRKQKQNQKKKQSSKKGPNAFQMAKNRAQSRNRSEIKGFIETVQTRESIWHTLTGEVLMMARLHFSGIDSDEIVSFFSQMKCMAFDEERNRWFWLYRDESRHLDFKLPYDAVPQANHPVVLGVFAPFGIGDSEKSGRVSPVLEDRELHGVMDSQGSGTDLESGIRLCVSSFDRAVKAVAFFDRILPQGIGEAARLTIMNRVFEVTPGGDPPLPDSEHHFKDAAMVFGVRERFKLEIDALKQALNTLPVDRQVELLEQFWSDGVPYLIPDFEVLHLGSYHGLEALRRALAFREEMAILKHDAALFKSDAPTVD